MYNQSNLKNLKNHIRENFLHTNISCYTVYYYLNLAIHTQLVSHMGVSDRYIRYEMRLQGPPNSYVNLLIRP